LYAYKVNPHVLDRLKLEDPYAPKLFRSKCRRRTELSSGLNFDLTELDPLQLNVMGIVEDPTIKSKKRRKSEANLVNKSGNTVIGLNLIQ
jgi:hypothetical protein